MIVKGLLPASIAALPGFHWLRLAALCVILQAANVEMFGQSIPSRCLDPLTRSVKRNEVIDSDLKTHVPLTQRRRPQPQNNTDKQLRFLID